jgi:PAS domain-containing protein
MPSVAFERGLFQGQRGGREEQHICSAGVQEASGLLARPLQCAPTPSAFSTLSLPTACLLPFVIAPQQPQVLANSGAMMVVDHRGRITYATNKLGAMLGLSAKQLAGRDLSSLMPVPISQLHGGFMRVGPLMNGAVAGELSLSTGLATASRQPNWRQWRQAWGRP